MHVMVTIDHPWRQSFCHHIFERVVATLDQDGHTVDALDLHAEDFDPVLHVDELAIYTRGGWLDPKVAEYQQRIRQAQHLVYIFPVWWEVMPALLKGFFDKVFLPEFAFREADFSPLLGFIERATVITTMGAPRPVYTSVEAVLCKGILETCGVRRAQWLNLADIPNTTHEQRLAWVEEVLSAVRGLG